MPAGPVAGWFAVALDRPWACPGGRPVPAGKVTEVREVLWLVKHRSNESTLQCFVSLWNCQGDDTPFSSISCLFYNSALAQG